MVGAREDQITCEAEAVESHKREHFQKLLELLIVLVQFSLKSEVSHLREIEPVVVLCKVLLRSGEPMAS